MKKFAFNACIIFFMLCRTFAYPLQIIQTPTQNFNDRKDCKTGKLVITPTFIILHFTGNCDRYKIVQMFLDYVRPVSAHYVIAPDGSITQMVDESKRAWHAGKASWDKNWQINTYSIGIEIVNPGYTQEHVDPCSIFDQAVWNKNTGIQVAGSNFFWQPFTKQQIESVIELCAHLTQKYNIDPHHILGHSDVAPGRKVDPGPLFPWKKLAHYGIGLWHNSSETDQTPIANAQGLFEFQKDLKKFGYKIIPYKSETLDDMTRKATQAFQMHFRPEKIDGVPDKQSAAILKDLLNKLDPRLREDRG